MTTKDIILIQKNHYQVDVKSFSINPELDGQMNSGYIVDYQSKEKKFRSECLDVDHVYRELDFQGLDSKLIDFILIQL